ncbi:MAG: cohesin domain-containing protein [Candidatus Parcubacteria bacterium]|nr:cohesin domain-containing protein [Candidatus Parcubacteria bacterium]
MKKIFIVLLISLVLTLISLPALAASATLSLTSSKTTYKVGDVLKVSININSDGNALQVVRAKVSYPADLLQAQGFTLGSLFPQKSPGEIIGGGTLYVGGYRIGEGTSSNGVLGTATFKVIKAGKAALSLVAGSRMVTAEPKDIYSGGNSLAFTLNTVEKPKEEINPAKPQEKIILTAPEISSAANPEDAWSKSNSITLNWTKPANALGYVTKLSADTLEDIGETITTKDNTATYNNVGDGIWIFYLKAKYQTGFSELANYTLKIDTIPPVVPQPSIEAQLNQNNANTYQILFNTTDALAGIDHYQIKFDDSEFKNANSPYILNSNEKEAKFVTVKAVDKAGNESTGVLAISDYIASQDKIALQKTTLFDIQANAVKQSQLTFYIVLAAIIAIITIVIIAIIVRNRKKS